MVIGQVILRAPLFVYSFTAIEALKFRNSSGGKV